MIRVVPFATALAVVSSVCYVLGAVVALIAPGLLLALYQAWAFLDLSQFTPGGVFLTLPMFIVGLLTVIVVTWVFGAAWAALYNVLLGWTGEARTAGVRQARV